MSETVDILRRAKGIVRSGWCQHARALTSAGLVVLSSDTMARRFCATGAIMRAISEIAPFAFPTPIRAVARALTDAIGQDSIIQFNDAPTTTKADVLDAFDRAIADVERVT